MRRRVPERALHPARDVPHQSPLRRSRWSRAACSPNGTQRKGRLTVPGAAKVPFFNRRMLAEKLGLAEDKVDLVENDVGGGFGARGEFYPEDFLIPFAARHHGPPGQMDRGPPREPDGDAPCARGGVRHRDRLRARRHDPRAARPRLGRYGRLYPHQRIGGAAQHRAVHVGAVPHPEHPSRRGGAVHQQDAVGTYRGPGRFETDFFRERLFDLVAKDLGIDRVEFRRRNLVSQAEMPYHIAKISPYDAETEYDSGNYASALARCLKEIRLGEEGEAAGQADPRPLSRHRGRLLHRRRRGGAEGERADRARTPTARSTIYVGSSAIGQGLETVFSQIAADALEMPLDRVRSLTARPPICAKATAPIIRARS